MTAAASLPTMPPLPITGPASLLECLRELPLPTERPLVAFAWLDEQRTLVHVSTQAEVDLLPLPAFVVEVSLLPESATAAEVAASRESLAGAMSLAGVMMLDRLVCRGDRWWSALCSDQECCPLAGRRIRSRSRSPRDAARRKAWQQLQDSRDRTAAAGSGIAAELAITLADRAVRDCVLSDLGHRPEGREDWLRLFQSTAPTGDPNADAAVQTIIAAIAYLAEDQAEVAVRLAAAEAYEPEYSLAKLLRQAIAISAPTELALSAFCSYTSEQLLEIAAAADEQPKKRK